MILGPRARLATPARKAMRANGGRKEYRAFRALRALKVRWVIRARLDRKALRVQSV